MGSAGTISKVLVAFCIVAAIVILAAFTTPATAQDPVGGALATLAAATAQAEQWRAAQAATRSAQEATQQAQAVYTEATRQAQAAQATQSALDEINRKNVAVATAQALEMTATASAVEAQMVATRQAQAAQATRDGQDAEATRAAYALAYEQSREQAQVGQTLLWIAAIIAILGTAAVVLTWVRKAASYVPDAEGVVIDANPVKVPSVPLLEAPAMPGVTVISDRGTIERFSKLVEEGVDNE